MGGVQQEGETPSGGGAHHLFNNREKRKLDELIAVLLDANTRTERG